MMIPKLINVVKMFQKLKMIKNMEDVLRCNLKMVKNIGKFVKKIIGKWPHMML